MAPLTAAAVWIQAARPRTLTAILAPVLVGTALAHADGRFRILPAFMALLAGVLIQIGTNIANDYYDFLKGADTSDRVGAVRVTQAGLLAPTSVRNAVWVVFGGATVTGVYLVAVGGWPVFIVGIASIAAGIGYTAGRFAIGYIGLGDVFTFVFFGPVAVAGTYYVQALAVTPGALLAGAGIGALVTAILVVNNLRDIPTDRAAGKRTLAVRFGVTATRAEYVALLAAGAVVPLVGWRLEWWPATVLISAVTLVLSVGPLRRVLTFTDPRTLNPALGGTAVFVGAFGIAFAAGLAL